MHACNLFQKKFLSILIKKYGKKVSANKIQTNLPITTFVIKPYIFVLENKFSRYNQNTKKVSANKIKNVAPKTTYVFDFC